MRYRRKIAALWMAAALCLGSLTGCGDGTRVVFTAGFGKDEVFRVEDVSCQRPELMVYLTTTQNQYESVYGEEIWNTTLDGVTLEENVKETVLAKIAQIKTMYLLARERQVTLEETEEELVSQAANTYFSALNATEIERMGVSLETIENLYREYAMAHKVYELIIQDINPEISDDEARTITVQHILIRTGTSDGQGNKIDYSQEEKQEAYEQAQEIREMALDEANDFVQLANRYSEDSNITYSFGKGEMDTAFESAAFELETGEISQVIESRSGYHIIKCISTFNREETDANKVKIVQQRRDEVFGQEYDSFVATLARRLNQEVWDEITLIHDSQVTTSDFFDVYTQYFSKL